MQLNILAFWFLPFFAFVSMLLSNGVEAQDAEQRRMQITSTNDSQELMEKLKRKALRDGTVRVIVRYRASDAAEAFLSDDQIVSRRAEIANNRGVILQRLESSAGFQRAQLVRSFEVIPSFVLEATTEALSELIADPLVESIHEDGLNRLSLQESTQLIGADNAWALGFRGAGKVVAVLDNGVDSTHPALVGKVVSEACYSTNHSHSDAEFVSLCPGQAPSSIVLGAGRECDSMTWGSGCSHGTHVAGIVAGSDPAAPEIRGVAPEAKIIAVQVFSGLEDFTVNGDYCGGVDRCVLAFNSDVIAGLERVFSLSGLYDIAAVNLSLGGGSFTDVCDASPYKLIIDQLREAGIATVIASGNDFSDGSTSSPGCVSSAVTVGSSTKTDQLSIFSNHAPWVDLIAPGSGICASVTGLAATNCSYAYGVLSGTSMAAPHVAGAFAVISSINSSAENSAFEVSRVESLLKATGVPVETYLGSFPRIDLGAASQLMITLTGNSVPELIAISTRGFIGAGANHLIAGFVVGGTGATVLVKARGPSLAGAGVPGVLANPVLTVFSGQTPIASNDDWQTSDDADLIFATGQAPPHPAESAALLNLAPGPYTVIVEGVAGATGVGIVEVFEASTFADQ